MARGYENKEFYVSPPEEMEEGDDPGEKTVIIRLEGEGEIKVIGGNANKKDIVDVLAENMKGIFMNIIQQEILEEGEMSYEF